MKREIRIDLLGIGHLLKGIQYLLFPAAIGVDLLRDLVEAAAKTEVRDIEMRSRERTSKVERRRKNEKEEADGEERTSSGAVYV